MSDQKKDRDAAHAIFGGIGDSGRQPTQPVSPQPPSTGSYGQGYAAPPAPPAPPAPQSPWANKPMLVLVILLAVISGIGLYLAYSVTQELKDTQAMREDQLNLLTRRLDTNDQVYADLKGQLQVSAEKLGLTRSELARARRLAGRIQEKQKEAVSQLSNAIEEKASTEELNQLQAETKTKFSTLSTSLDDTRKGLAETKKVVAGTRTELAGMIAGNREELVALARRGDKDYFEFDLDRKGAKQKIGTVLVELRKVNFKRNLYSVRLSYDDKRTERRNKALNEPVHFYLRGAPFALEMVVNKIEKKGVAGYISTPREFFPNMKDVLQGRPEA